MSMEGIAPLGTWIRALRQWVALLALLWLRAAILRLPLPALEWMVGRYRFDWLDVGCDVNRCLLRYWGRYTVSPGDPLIPGWYLVQATHRTTGVRYYAFRAAWQLPVLGVLHVRLGYCIKPSVGNIKIPGDTRPLFEFRRVLAKPTNVG